MHELRKLLDAPPDEVIRQVLDRTGYRSMLQGQPRRGRPGPPGQHRGTDHGRPAVRGRGPTAHASADFLENITLASDVDGWDEQQDCVSVMTLHAAKGLEFPVVYMLAVEQGILPHERSLGKHDEMEEERRLAFVGMTRAKEELYLTPCPAARIPRPDAVRGAEHVPERAGGGQHHPHRPGGFAHGSW